MYPSVKNSKGYAIINHKYTMTFGIRGVIMAEWIIICDANAYDIKGAFEKFDKINWKQSTKVEVDDIVYIYVGNPVSALKYKCKATKVELPNPEIDDSEFELDNSAYKNYGRYMELSLLKKLDNKKLSYHNLKENGLNTVQGPSHVTNHLSSYLFSVIETGGSAFDYYLPKGKTNKTRREVITILHRAYDRPVTARELTDIMYEVGKPQASVFTELTDMEKLGLVTKYSDSKPYTYSVVKNIGTPNYYYVFQNQSFDKECAEGYLWAPKFAKDGYINHHWSRLQEVKPGDVIFHGYKQYVVAISIAKSAGYTADNPDGTAVEAWAKEGWRVDTDYHIFHHAIAPKDYWSSLQKLQPAKYAPFDKSGNGNRGYVFSINKKMANYLLDATAGKYDVDEAQKESSEEDAEILSLVAGNQQDKITNLIKEFKKRLPELLKKEAELEELRIKFVNDYNMQKIMNMTKEEYVVGLDSKDSFCYRIETELQELGNIHGSTSVKFGLYYGKSGEDTELQYRPTIGKFGDDPDKALEQIKEQIVYLRMDGANKNYDAIRKCKLSSIFRGKILSTFFPEDYLCIFAEEHLNYFITQLGMTYTSADDILSKQIKLVEWKKARTEMKDWNNHIFSKFLYEKCGHPFEVGKTEKEIQEERDKAYPKHYVTNIGVTVSQWKALLKNSDVFRVEDIELLTRFYTADNHATTCYDLGIEDGVSPTSYVTPIVNLAKRITAELNLAPIKGEEGKQVWWRVPFWGMYREDGKFEWKLRPELAKAMAAVFPGLSSMISSEIEEKEDDKLVSGLKNINVNVEGFEYTGVPKAKPEPSYVGGHKTYKRDKQVALNALAHAHYECEIDVNHPTFIRKKSDKKYTEPHHLVPMAFSDDFLVSLDREENIVSLCSNCHNQIHYGQDADKLIEKLYYERKEALESVGIKISLEKLLSMYGYKKIQEV